MIHSALLRLRLAATSVLGVGTGPGDRSSERGANLVEYVLLLALIVLVCIGAVAVLGDATSEPYSELSSQLGS